MQSIASAPRQPGAPINTDVGVVGWAQELRGPERWEPLIRVGGWRRMVNCDVLGWAFVRPLQIVNPREWTPID